MIPDRLIVEHIRSLARCPAAARHGRPLAWPFPAMAARHGARMLKPSATSWSRPTSRVSPWAMVFVASSPASPPEHSSSGPQEEIGAEVGAATLAMRQMLHQILAVLVAQRAGDLLPAHERRIADDGGEARAGRRPLREAGRELAVDDGGAEDLLDEDLGELQRPVERSATAEQCVGARAQRAQFVLAARASASMTRTLVAACSSASS